MRKRAYEVEPGDVLDGFMLYRRHVKEVSVNSGGKVILRYSTVSDGYPAFSTICNPGEMFTVIQNRKG